MTKTTTREYDDEGRMVRETIVEQTDPPSYPLPVTPSCTCYGLLFGYCQVHGYRGYQPTPYIWCGTSTTAATLDSYSTASPTTNRIAYSAA
jgi:hypothetical protein